MAKKTDLKRDTSEWSKEDELLLISLILSERSQNGKPISLVQLASIFNSQKPKESRTRNAGSIVLKIKKIITQKKYPEYTDRLIQTEAERKDKPFLPGKIRRV